MFQANFIEKVLLNFWSPGSGLKAFQNAVVKHQENLLCNINLPNFHEKRSQRSIFTFLKGNLKCKESQTRVEIPLVILAKSRGNRNLTQKRIFYRVLFMKKDFDPNGCLGDG